MISSSDSESEKAIVSLIEDSIKTNKRIALLTDFDYTISVPNLDPRICTVYAPIVSALQRIINAGITVGIISSRPGVKIAEVTSALRPILIVGSRGWETYTPGKHENESVTSDLFLPYAGSISKVLGSVKNALITYFKQPTIPSAMYETSISTPGGVTVLERKGINSVFPEGLLHNYNLNAILPAKRREYVALFSDWYTAAISAVAQTDTISEEKLQAIAGLHMTPNRLPEELGMFSLGIAPDRDDGKAYALQQFLSPTNDPKRDAYFSDMPGDWDLIMYFGDADEDAYAFETAKQARAVGQDVYSVWVEPEEDQPLARKTADFHVKGVEANAVLLTRIAEIIENNA